MEQRPIVIKIQSLIGHLVIVGKDTDFLEVERKVTEALLKAVETAHKASEEFKNSDQEI